MKGFSGILTVSMLLNFVEHAIDRMIPGYSVTLVAALQRLARE
jgi:hypothetical protein